VLHVKQNFLQRTGLTAVVGFGKILLGSIAQFYLQVQNIFKCKIVIRPLEPLLIVVQMLKFQRPATIAVNPML
jgi:hypothetical protein